MAIELIYSSPALFNLLFFLCSMLNKDFKCELKFVSVLNL